MQLGLDVSQHQLTWPQLLERVRYLESAGFDGAWLFDHFKALYGDPSGPCLEAWTLLAALAASTTRVRLGTLVTGMTYRNPSMLAMEAVTVDHVSDGRVELAVGAGWFEEEHRELGFEFPSVRQRAERLEEGVELMRKLMTAEDVTYEGKHYRLEHAAFYPRPVQQPTPPIWIGASGEKLMLPIVARQADVWHDSGDTGEVIRKSRLLDHLAEEAGRDPQTIRRASSISLEASWDDVRRKAERLREAGFFYLICDWPGQGRERVDEFIEQVMPALQAL